MTADDRMRSGRRPVVRLQSRVIGDPRIRKAGALVLVGLILALSRPAQCVRADSNGQVLINLNSHDVYIANHFFQHGKAQPGDLNRLQSAVYDASRKGISEKIALVWHFPPSVGSPGLMAHDIRHYLDFSGVLIVVSPRGVGLSTDTDLLSGKQMTSIALQADARCQSSGYVSCAVLAANLAVAPARASKDSAARSAAIFWLVVLGILALIIVGVVTFNVRRRRRSDARLNELRGAAGNTVSLADSAVTDIEASGQSPPEGVRAEYDRALGLRNRARTELDGAKTAAALTQANEDAAQAVLALQGVMKRMNLTSPLASPVDLPARKCFYCGREDRPPYVSRTIDDGRGNSMNVDICAVCAQQLSQGRTPQIATVQYGSAAVPWWAVPTSPWYYGYGGPTWQYWLPFLIGMDVGGWFGGGWYGPDPGYVPAGDYGYADPGQVPSDAGGPDTGDWGSGAGNGGDWGGPDVGGGDWSGGGGDWGGGDAGGGDFGGGDLGGGGDWGG